METKKINELTAVTNLATGDKLLSLNAGGSGQVITPENLLASLMSKATENKTPASTLYIPIYENGKVVTKVSIADLAAVVSGVGVLQGAEDNVFIMYNRKADNKSIIIRPSAWTPLQSNGEKAEGVAIMAGNRILVVSPTESSLPWSSAAAYGGGIITYNPITALADMAGQANTAAQITHPECQGTSYAPGYCAAYTQTNANGYGLTSGKWWLPSMGELLMIYANLRKINYALSFINEATQLTETPYWSSTEVSATTAWYISLKDGTANNYNKSLRLRLRPVSTFM